LIGKSKPGFHWTRSVLAEFIVSIVQRGRLAVCVVSIVLWS